MQLLNEFSAELGKHFQGDIRLDRANRILYSTDASIYQIEPLGVVLPRSQEDLQAVVELAGKYKVPILPRGSGSSLAGQAIGQALILDCSRWLNALIEIDPDAQTATVEPGLILSALNNAAEKHGLTFGPDPASAERATLGGVIGNNATGAHSIRYGMTADHLVSARVIYSDGSTAEWGRLALDDREQDAGSRHANFVSVAKKIHREYGPYIKQQYPQTWRNSAGYRLNYLLPWSPSAPALWSGGRYPRDGQPSTVNLAPMLAGSEGTLAVISQATVHLVPRDRHTILGVLVYKSIAEACDDVPRILEFNPSAVELVPQMLIRLARSVPAYSAQMGWVSGDPAALLVVEFSGESPEGLKAALGALGPGVQVAESRREQQQVWNVRKVGLGIFDSRPADARPVAFIEDCAIPVEKLGSFVREVERILDEHGTHAAFYAHASAGCLHIRPILNLKSGQGRRALRSIAEATFSLTQHLGGAMSSEHGDGIARAEFLRQAYGAEVLEAMRMVKQAADPDNLLNPGKMLDGPVLDAHLRYHEGYQATPWQPDLDFSRNNQLSGAIEQCNGQGVCRKDGGVMCPSFQATREEANSTRGRANLLRALISAPGLAGADYHELEEAAFQALDLCLACKGCKSECPSSVDMAKLKYEFQRQYYRTHSRRLRDYFFAYIGPIARSGALLGDALNGLIASPLFCNLSSRTLGLARPRSLPKYSKGGKPMATYLPGEAALESVLLLRDTFTHYFEAGIERDILEVLAASGVNVKVLPGFGAGRTLLSKGFIGPARRQAEKVLSAIRRLDARGSLPVIGIEPSELYAIRDEWFDLMPERAGELAALAGRTWLVEEFLLRPGKDGNNRILRVVNYLKGKKGQATPAGKALLHGHCYQKAQLPAADGFPVGQEASAGVLRAVGYDVQVIPSGCCGMAGAFGYEAEHYEISMQVGELELLPAVRKGHADGARICAVGTSCRSQIEHGAGVQAQHPLQLVAQLLRS